MVGAIRQQSAADFAKLGLPPEEIDTLVDKMGDVLGGGLQADAMKQDFARIFTEVYTPDELRVMAGMPAAQKVAADYLRQRAAAAAGAPAKP